MQGSPPRGRTPGCGFPRACPQWHWQRTGWPQYKWSNILAVLKNMNKEPKRCAEPFRDRLAVITGATAGVGYHTAWKYASMGACIVMINRNAEKSEGIRKEITAEYGVPVEYLIADLSGLPDIQRAGVYLAGLGRPLDVLIHNAGVPGQARSNGRRPAQGSVPGQWRLSGQDHSGFSGRCTTSRRWIRLSKSTWMRSRPINP